MQLRQFLGMTVLSMILIMEAPFAEGAPSPADSLAFVGTFYSERFTEDHEYLYQLDLWSQRDNVLGLYSSIEGLVGDGGTPYVRIFHGTLRSDTLRLSNHFVGVLRDSVLIGAYRDGDAYEMKFTRSTDQMELDPSSAPRTGPVSWHAWANKVIDDVEGSNSYLNQQKVLCARGDSWACVGIGNRYQERKPEEARRYWKLACDGGAWPGCRFLGDSTRYHALLRQSCNASQKPSLHRNMACEVLGGMAEQRGRKEEAIRWYRLGCNENGLPLTCCRRLKALGVKPPSSASK